MGRGRGEVWCTNERRDSCDVIARELCCHSNGRALRREAKMVRGRGLKEDGVT